MDGPRASSLALNGADPAAPLRGVSGLGVAGPTAVGDDWLRAASEGVAGTAAEAAGAATGLTSTGLANVAGLAAAGLIDLGLRAPVG